MKRLVIIGGGFAGSTIARRLEKKLHVILIDTKNYFEFTPGILRTIVDPSHVKKIQVLHNHYLHHAEIITGEVTEISQTEVNVGGKRIPFDYLAICAGSRYNLPIKEQNIIIATRATHLRDEHHKLVQAKEIIIIGGGLVGIELAAEIRKKYPKKQMTLIHSGDTLIPRMNQKAIAYVTKFLEKQDIKIIYNEKVIKRNKEVITDKGTKIKCDIAFLCTGITPNFESLQKHFKEILTPRNQIQVNEYLQVKGYQNIFAAGDITAVEEEKTAQNAERQGQIVVKNILNLEENKPLVPYLSKPRIMVTSLGKYDGMLTYKNFTLTGIIPGILKSKIEYKEMLKFKK